MSSGFSIDFPEHTSDFRSPLTFFSLSVCINFLNSIMRKIWVIKLLGLAEIFIVFTAVPLVSVLEGRHIMHRHH